MKAILRRKIIALCAYLKNLRVLKLTASIYGGLGKLEETVP